MAYSKIHPVSFGVAVGVISGLSTFFMGLMALFLYTGKPLVAMLGTMYVTYNPSLFNSVVGGVAVSVNGFIAAYIISLVYNLMLKIAK